MLLYLILGNFFQQRHKISKAVSFFCFCKKQIKSFKLFTCQENWQYPVSSCYQTIRLVCHHVLQQCISVQQRV